LRKPKEQSRKGNIETETTLDTRHRTKTNKTKTQHRSLRRWATRNPDAWEGQAVPASSKILTDVLIKWSPVNALPVIEERKNILIREKIHCQLRNRYFARCN